MIELKNIQPTPLKETPGGISPASGIFGTECHFEKGKRYLVNAASGKGKSTFLHIIYGLRSDYEGQASINGKNVRSFSPNEWAECRQRQLSIVFQDLRLFPQLSGLENIQLKNGQTQMRTEAEIMQMAEQLGMTPYLQQSAATLSYGQRQRIAILRALCQPFEILLLDEPFSHLDEENTRNACHLISSVCGQQSAGMVMVSLGEEYFFSYDKKIDL
ncbi:MAG: ATP-binding cassette domain-containing protein [Saprospiraceae bacterium]|nr:ATP-binding cassette domain-containing protein [Saprospiraceae bacterium]